VVTAGSRVSIEVINADPDTAPGDPDPGHAPSPTWVLPPAMAVTGFSESLANTFDYGTVAYQG
jgi:hypothetical protein